MADYVWTDAHGRGRNRYAMFRRSMVLQAGASGLLRIFADTRYRLIVNGATVGHGPARFFRSQPEYDELDVTRYLVVGENVIAVLVNSVGAVHFQGERSEGALIVMGSVRDGDGTLIALDTPGAWRGIESPAHARDTHPLTFALGPAEQLDLSGLPEGWDRPGFDGEAWSPVVVREGTDYGPLSARSIPLLDERAVVPRRLAGVFAGRSPEAEDVYSLRLAAEDKSRHGEPASAAVLTYVFSPVRQTVTFQGWWGRYFLAGQELKSGPREEGRRRQPFTVTLEPGWTPLVCAERFHWSVWELFLRFPSRLGIELSATRQVGSAELFRGVGPFMEGTPKAVSLPGRLARLSETLRPNEGWVWPRSLSAESPHRERANLVWTRLGGEGAAGGGWGEVNLGQVTLPQGTTSVAVLYDLGTEVLGRPRLRFDAPAGTRVDLGYCESLAPDGTAHLHQRYLVDMCERYIAREGPQSIHTFHPRGGRYLEVRFTPPSPDDLPRIRLIEVELTRAQYPLSRVGESAGSFTCSDPQLNEIWELGPRTLQPCMEDAYLDCPMRERGLYVGDALVQFHSNLAAFGDTKLFRRSLELFWRSADQGDNGLVAGGCHGIPAGRHPDYSALMPWGMRAYHAASGDRDFLLHHRSRLVRLLEGLDGTTVAGSALVDGTHLGVYIDTAVHDHDGVSATQNAMTAAAFLYGAEVLQLIGDASEAERWRERYQRLRAAFHDAFYCPQTQAYLDRRRADKPDTAPSVHGNSLALLFGLASLDVHGGVVRLIRSKLLDNAPTGSEGPGLTHRTEFNVSSYFSFYTLTAMTQHGDWPFVLDFVRKNWSIFLDAGSPTTWEYFGDHASLCHAWSTCPTHLLSRHALGVSFPFPGDLSRVRIDPDTRGLAFAEGVVPHPGGAGPIWVSWECDGDRTRTQIRLPRGVTRV